MVLNGVHWAPVDRHCLAEYYAKYTCHILTIHPVHVPVSCTKAYLVQPFHPARRLVPGITQRPGSPQSEEILCVSGPASSHCCPTGCNALTQHSAAALQPSNRQRPDSCFFLTSAFSGLPHDQANSLNCSPWDPASTCLFYAAGQACLLTCLADTAAISRSPQHKYTKTAQCQCPGVTVTLSGRGRTLKVYFPQVCKSKNSTHSKK